MTKRYNKPLKEHIRIAEEHALFLVKRLAFLANRAKSLQEKQKQEEADEIYNKMALVVEELAPVEAWLKESYPQLTELYDVIKKELK